MPAAATDRFGRLLELVPSSVHELVEDLRSKDILLFASGLAFYALVSVVPLIILVLWVVGAMVGDQRVQHLADALRTISPQSLGADKALQQVSRLGTQLGAPAAVASLWPATSYGAGLVRAFDRIGPRHERNLKGLRGRGLAFVVLLPLFIIGALVSSYLGTSLLGDSGFALAAGIVLAFLLAFAAASVAIAVIYKIFPPRPLGLRGLLRGTFAAAGGISVLSVLYSVYLGTAADFRQHYATSGLAAIVLLAVWLFLANVMILVGFVVALRK
jgi:membrane protein